MRFKGPLEPDSPRNMANNWQIFPCGCCDYCPISENTEVVVDLYCYVSAFLVFSNRCLGFLFRGDDSASRIDRRVSIGDRPNGVDRRSQDFTTEDVIVEF